MGIQVTPIPRLTVLAVPAFTLDTVNAAGSALTAIASNSTLLAFDAIDPAAVAASAVVGTAVVASRRDHVHTGLIASDISCRLTDSGPAQSAANNSTTAVTWDTETFDTDTMHSDAPNPSRITFTTAGKYIVAGLITFQNTSSAGGRAAYITINGGTKIAASVMLPESTSLHMSINVTTGVYDFSATDYVELVGEVADAPGAIPMLVNTPMWFSAVKVTTE